MLARYALIAGRGANRHEALAAAGRMGNPRIVDRPHFLLIAERGSRILETGNAVLVGDLFTRTGERIESLEKLLGCGPPGAGPGSLAGHWGNFVLFECSEGRTSAYRDPSGNVCAYRFRLSGETAFVSDAAFGMQLGLVRQPKIDRHFVAHWLQYPFLRTKRCGIAGAEELLPGVQALEVGGAWTEKAVWRPSDFVSPRDAIFDPDEASQALRATALASIAPQIGDEPMVLQLSGGLDSSILAACLAKSGRRPAAVNFATRSADGDERSYAREVADRFGIDLHELAEEDAGALLPDPAPDFRPGVNPLLMPFDRAIGKAAARLGARLLIDGGGGDNLFCFITSAAPLLDALKMSGPAEALRAGRDIADRSGSPWSMVAKAAGKRLLEPVRRWKEDRSLLAPEACLDCPDPHPWLDGLPRALPGKKEHVEALVHIQHFLDRGAALSTRTVHPLMAQPLLELCLRIPSWLWMRGGRDRAIAREAFSDLVPASVLKRRAKGSLQSLFHRSFRTMIPGLRELILAGELASSGIIDAARVENAFATEDLLQRDDLQLRLTELAALELWLQSWRAIAPSASLLGDPSARTVQPFSDRRP